MKALKGKVVVVTGGRTRVGRLLVRALIAVEASVMAADQPGQDEPGEPLPARGPHLARMEVDVTSPYGIDRLMSACETRFGRIDLLITNNTSTDKRRPAGLDKLTVDAWHQAMDRDVLGPFLCCRAALPAFARAGGGQVIHIVSAPPPRQANSLQRLAGNGALLAMTRALAAELRPAGVSLNCVAAGYPPADVSGMAFTDGRAPADVFEAVGFLARHAGPAFTGQTIAVEQAVADAASVQVRVAHLTRRGARRQPDDAQQTA